MRIAYIAPYQGPTFFKLRPSLTNLGLAANLKIELISELLVHRNHEMEVISPGVVNGPRWRIYRAVAEKSRFHPNIEVNYASVLPLKFVDGLWSGWKTLALLKSKHERRPFDLAIVYNLGPAQIKCAEYVARRLRIPLVLEYEDDACVDIVGGRGRGLRSVRNARLARNTLESISGGIAVSPYLLAQFPAAVPKLLLRGVVSNHILEASTQVDRKNWVIYSGTHTHGKGLEQLISGWSLAKIPGWQLHIAGHGEITAKLEQLAKGDKGILFHGLLNRVENARFLGQAKIGINPHEVSRTQGNVFAFKIIEYLAAGIHCISTPMGALEPEIELGLTYMPDNSPETIASTLKQVIEQGSFERLAVRATQDAYGPKSVAESLDGLIQQVCRK